jgi:hypothetical protein
MCWFHKFLLDKLRFVPEFDSEDPGRKATGRFDHWGAAESGLQLGVIWTRLYAACRDSAALNGALVVFICFYLHLFPCLSMAPGRF